MENKNDQIAEYLLIILSYFANLFSDINLFIRKNKRVIIITALSIAFVMLYPSFIPYVLLIIEALCVTTHAVILFKKNLRIKFLKVYYIYAITGLVCFFLVKTDDYVKEIMLQLFVVTLHWIFTYFKQITIQLQLWGLIHRH